MGAVKKEKIISASKGALHLDWRLALQENAVISYIFVFVLFVRTLSTYLP